ncbi:hypothetical protein ACFQ0M_10255 [Kitasatospora aburaviensis]
MVGIARVDVVDADPAAGKPPLLVVRLQPADAADRAPWLLDRAGYALSGGARLHPRITDVTPHTRPPGRGDPAARRRGRPRRLHPGPGGESADPFHGTAGLRFRLDCAGTDCATEPATAAPPAPATVRIDYLARDFEGFRRALQDFVPTRAPAGRRPTRPMPASCCWSCSRPPPTASATSSTGWPTRPSWTLRPNGARWPDTLP